MSEPAEAGWDDLARECDAWAALGRPVELWWRDDDAVADTPELRRLLGLAAGRAPLALAVIPAELAPDLADAFAPGDRSVAVLQHGFDHRNRAATGAKKSEFPADRAGHEVRQALARGREALAAAFGRRFLPVLTPPWNRFDAGHLSILGEVGLGGLTAYLPRRAQQPAPGITQVNTHVDVIDWQAQSGDAGKRAFLGRGRCLGLLVAHLQAKRAGRADGLEPSGLLTHHRVHDRETWQFLGDLLDWCGQRPGITWRSAADLFPGFQA